ncbi:class I SAM-dependent RNA methyltransferase [Williamsia sterculiae]|uniref:tRNA/tmRNA/rRNA uracil-C5-methylase, TrmA/RlmC/RlmD family n=1 Tax=Williamsia sterculiae TaxID=1344003 RepID=A0A1N7EFQ5_9NOCA|nr:TRAM domain-containing protein [Williamsia sterculiae]SIR86818.1 tRNA/tmRNA/rRNA uracil-C5-methylase, TrmA/RlmC/RlmD family [Williamsia sterculiae]
MTGLGWVGQVLTVEITGFAHGGLGVARHDGRVVFVRGALPDERVTARVVDDRKAAFCHAELVEVLTPSVHRIDPVCPAAAAGAGCCDLSFVTGSHGRELKSRALADQLRRIGGVDWEGVVEPIGSSDTDAPQVGWRTRVRLAVDADGRLGYHRHGSDEVIAQTDCAQPVAGLTDGLAGLGGLRPGTELVVSIDDAVGDAAPARQIVQIAAPSRGRGRQRRRPRTGPPRVIEGGPTTLRRVGERMWQVPVTGFWQAHRDAALVYSDVVTGWASTGAEVAVGWDLYGGVGVLAGALRDAGVAQVWTAEGDATATAVAVNSFADDSGVHPVTGSTETVVTGLPRPGVVVADPPRSGAGRAVVAAICAAGPDTVIHVGCDPAALARDLRLFAEHGYRVRDIRGFDAFPLTHHVEAIAVLNRDR